MLRAVAALAGLPASWSAGRATCACYAEGREPVGLLLTCPCPCPLDCPPACPALQENYGKDEEEAVQRVKEVYRQLELEALFK